MFFIAMIFQAGFITTNTPIIPPGVTVTPTPPIRQLAANNISVSCNTSISKFQSSKVPKF